MAVATEQLARELRFLKAKASKYAFYGVIIASLSVVLATLLVSYYMLGEISTQGIIAGQSGNIALWVLDAMPFLFAAWGQYASFSIMSEAESFVEHKTRGLRSTLEEVRYMSQIKSDFFSKMSHELRTPLNGIIGMIDMLLDTRLDEKQSRYARTVRSSADGLLNVINDLLDYSKIEAGKLRVDKVSFDLRECLDDVVTLLKAQAERKRLPLLLELPSDIPKRVIGDPGRLRQVVLNLTGNAVKFTERGQVVVRAAVVKSHAQRTTLRIEVHDTGIGIPAEAQAHLFKPYSQADAGVSRKFGGTGLGLVISKELVEAMEGEIGFDSTAGIGARFWFTVVFERDEAEAVAGTVPVAFAGLRVLLADDNAVTRSQLAAQLVALGMDVDQAGDGVEALQKMLVAANAGKPHALAIVDMFLPHLRGEELGREIKAHAQTRETVMILTTAVGQRGDAQRANEIGFAAYLTKPIPADGLSQLLGAALETRAMPDEVRRRRGIVTRYNAMPARAQGARLLVAEDSAVNREVLLHLLAKLGYGADVAVDGQEAVDAATKHHYDVILMDLQMPVMNGVDAIRAIRALPERADVPIVALTAGLSDDERRRCREAGANEVMLKPLDARALAATLLKLTTPQIPAGAPATKPLRDNPSPELLKVFLEEANARMSSLREGVRLADARRVALEAHTLKSTSAYFKADAMRELAARIEQLAGAGDLPEAASLLPPLERSYRDLKTRLRA